MVAKSLLVTILLRVILPLVVILVIVFGVLHFGIKSVNGIGWLDIMWTERNVKQVIAEFMQAGAGRNIEAAYDCLSHESDTEEEIGELIERSYDDVFAGYKRLSINRMTCERDLEDMRTGGGGADDGEGDGDSDGEGGGFQRCYANGEITYTSGRVLRFHGRIVKDNDICKIQQMTIGYRLVIRGYKLR